MSLFERIQNKRYDLQEAPIDDKGNITPEPGEIKKSEKIVKKFIKKQKKDKLSNQEISRRRSAETTRGDAINRSIGTSGSTEGAGGANTGTTQPKKPKITGDVTRAPKVNQADVSKKAKEFTKEIEKKRVKKLAPIDLNKPTKRVDLRKVDKKISRKRPSNAPSLADIKQKIDVKNPVEIGKTGPKPVKGTVLKVSEPSKITGSMKQSGMQQGVPQGFERIKKTSKKSVDGLNPEAKKIMSKQVSTDELLGNKKEIEKKIVNNTKNTTKPSLWSRTKSKLKDIHNWMKSDYRRTSGAGKYKNVTKNIYKNTLRGNTIRNINKVLPGRYKVLAAIATGAYLYSRGNKKDPGAAGAGGGPKKYYGANPKLKLDMKGSPPPPKAKESKK